MWWALVFENRPESLAQTNVQGSVIFIAKGHGARDAINNIDIFSNLIK